MMAFAICAIDEMPSANTATDTYESDAYGNAFTVSGSTPNEMMYRGEQFDSDLGLYYLRARYYNPTTGRFMSRDPEDGKPIDPTSLHKYLYAGGDPVNGLDPSGRASILETGAIDFDIVLEVGTVAEVAWAGISEWLVYYQGVARLAYLYATDVLRAINWTKTLGWLAKQSACLLAGFLVERYVAEPVLPDLHNKLANDFEKFTVVTAFDRVCIGIAGV